jgi:hypothetical protein
VDLLFSYRTTDIDCFDGVIQTVCYDVVKWDLQTRTILSTGRDLLGWVGDSYTIFGLRLVHFISCGQRMEVRLCELFFGTNRNIYDLQ